MRRRKGLGLSAATGSIMAAALALGGTVSSALAQGTPGPRPKCDPDHGAITLPPGFCAVVVADDVGSARHLVVAPNGDVFVALANRRGAGGGERGGVLALRDTTGDGRADLRVRFGDNGGTGIALRDGFLYFAPDDAVLRYRLRPGSLRPEGAPDTIVAGLPADRSHRAKSIALGRGNELFVNIGSPSNACQEQDRTAGSRGLDPCPDLATRAGIWKFHADRRGQTQGDGERYATGLRNVVALTVHPRTGVVYGAQHGRDQLSQNWRDLFTDQESAELPSEEVFRIDHGDDFGWPYCYHDWKQGAKVLAPEYGGNGKEIGRCGSKEGPLVTFPGHWAPNGLLFYSGSQFPARYRGGAFIAFHGSWNRAPLPQQGYKLVFVPFDGDRPARDAVPFANSKSAGDDLTFADGFAGAVQQPGNAAHRPVGLAQGPDGSLYVSDDTGGRIWRIVYTDR